MASNFFTENLLKNDLVAAPLAGISHYPFRRILRKFFDGIVYSEMCTAEGLMRKNTESMEYLHRSNEESPLVFQLFGGKPESFAEAVKIVANYTKTDAFDINMGCPVKKVLKSGGGCALLKDLPRVKEIVKAVRKATDIPFSIKIRIGLDAKTMVYNQVLDIAQSEGVDALILHGRTRADMFGGTVRLDILEEIAQKATIPIIGNGGIIDVASYSAMKKTGVNGVMIGRAMMKSPWIFAAVKENKPLENYLTPENIKNILYEMWNYMEEEAAGRPNKLTHYTHFLRKFAVWFSKGYDNAADFRVQIYQTQSKDEITQLIENFFTQSCQTA